MTDTLIPHIWPVIDDFERPNESPVTGWTKIGGVNAAIVGHKLVQGSSSTNQQWPHAGLDFIGATLASDFLPGGGDSELWFDLNDEGGKIIDMGWESGGTYWDVLDSDSAFVTIFESPDGVSFTEIGSAAFTPQPVAGDQLGVSYDDETIIAWIKRPDQEWEIQLSVLATIRHGEGVENMYLKGLSLEDARGGVIDTSEPTVTIVSK